jgi:hypothetical protein
MLPNVRSPLRVASLTLLGVLTLSCGGDGGGTGETPNPVPGIASLSRDTATATAAPFLVTVKGTGFYSGSVASIDDHARTTALLTDTTLTVQVTALELGVVGDHQVKVTNPGPGGGVGGPIPLHVLAIPVPTLDSISPSSSIVHSTALTLHAYGSGFVATSRIRWRGFDLTTTHLSGTHLTATVTAAMQGLPDTVAVTVFTPAPGGGTSTARTYYVDTPPPPPSITAASPDTLRPANDTIQLTLRGTRFTGADRVFYSQPSDSFQAIPTAVTDSSLTVALDRSRLEARQYLVIRVRTGLGTSPGFSILVEHRRLSVVGVAPDTMDGGKAIDTLIVTGSHFTSDTRVQVGPIEFAQGFIDSNHVLAYADQDNLLTLAGPATVKVFDHWDPANVDSIPIVIGTPAAVLDSIVPGVVAIGSADRSVFLFGHDLAIHGTPRVNGAARAVDLGSSGNNVVRVLLDSLDLAAADTLHITWENPAPTGGPSNTASLVIAPANPVPALDSMSIDHVVAGHAPSATIFGKHFIPGVKVDYSIDNGNFDALHSVTASVIDSSTLSVTIPDSSLPAGSTYLLRATNPGPTSGPSGVLSIPVWSTGIREVATVVTGTVQELIGDDRRGVVYATLGSTLRGYDIHTHLVTNSLALPLVPARTIMGGDSNSVWIAGKVTGARAYRIDLDAWAIVDSIVSPLGNSGFADILALPGQANAVVVSKTVIDTLTGGSTTVLAVFDAGIQRPDTIHLDDAIRFAGFAGGDTVVGMVYGNIFRAIIDSTGLHEVASLPTYLYYPGRATLSGNGILYYTSLYNATTGAAIHQYYPWGATASADDPAHHRMIVTSRSAFGDGFTRIFPLDPATGVEGIPDVMTAQGLVGPFTRFGVDGVAFSDGSARVVFVRAAAVEN